jgi:hypothetical protein
MEPEQPISRAELEGMLFAIADINANRGLNLLEEEFGGEEELPEEDG